MYNMMKNLINNKWYATEEEAQHKLDVFWAMNKISDLEYAELTQLSNSIYAPPVEMLPIEPVKQLQ